MSARDLPFETASFSVLRTPLLPFHTLSSFGADLQAAACTGDTAALAAALAQDRATLRERLRSLVLRPEVREALFIASPSLDESMPVWLERPDTERGRKVERTLVRYLARMAARSTPFGLFAGCTVAPHGERTRLRLGGLEGYRRHARLDNELLLSLTDHLVADGALRPLLGFRVNDSLYRTANRVRWVESQRDKGRRSYRLMAVDPTPYLEATLARARAGATLETLAAALVDEEITRADADAYVEELVASQILVADLEPQVTGAEPLSGLRAQLERLAPAHEGAAHVARILADAEEALRALDRDPLGAEPARYQSLAARLAELPVATEPSRLFQIDLFKSAPEVTIGAEVRAELERGLSLLWRINTSRTSPALSRFRERFRERYEQREVPLVEVLDEETGIGFERSSSPAADAPLLAGLMFAGNQVAQELSGPFFRILFKKYEEATRAGADEIVLTNDDLQSLERIGEHLRTGTARLPDSFQATATIAAASDEAIARNDFRLWIHGASGPCGASMIGRFCHGDAELERRTREYVADEERRRPDAVFAEIAHLPNGRLGNVILRPTLRAWEIELLGRSGAPSDRRLGVDDLMVSVRGDRIVLRSRRLDREVIPRLSSAHNFSSPRNLGVYHFLGALQNQEVPGLGFGWGALEAASFLPRVRMGRVVLSLARWRLSEPELKSLAAEDGDSAFLAAQTLRRERRLPRWVAVVDGDNVLPVDLDNVLSVETFVQLVKDRQSCLLTELFGAGEAACARGPEGAFVHELVFPCLARNVPESTAVTSRASEPPSPATAPRLQRSFLPGSEWLYAKLYTGVVSVDVLLLERLAPLLREHQASGAVDRWFFLRYGDPDWHLRLRLHGAPDRLRAEVLPALERCAAAALADGTLRKMQLDTYERELERYGGDEIVPLSEEIFCIDSAAVSSILSEVSRDDGARWRLTLRGIDQLLVDLGLSLEQRHELMRASRIGLGREYSSESVLAKQVGDRFRKERLALEKLLDPDHDSSSPWRSPLEALAQRSCRLRQVVPQLQRRIDARASSAGLVELAGSYVHMHANRMLSASARAQERVLYDFLERIYEGRIARAKKRIATVGAA